MDIIPDVSRTQLSPAVFIRRLAVGVLLLNLFVATLTFLSLRQSRLQYEEQAEVTSRNLAQLLEQNIDGSFDKIEVVLTSVAEEFEHQYARGSVDRKELNTFLVRLAASLPELEHLTVIDAQGNISYCTGTACATIGSKADSDIFTRLRDDPNPALLILRPIASRVSGKEVVILSRRISRGKSSFAGAVYGAISLDHFLRLFASIDVGPHGAIALRDGELGLIARFSNARGTVAAITRKEVSPEVREIFTSGRKSGTYKTRVPVDNTVRTYTSRKVSDYPLSIHVGLAAGDYLVHWRAEVVKLSAAASLFFLFTLCTALLIFRDWKRRMAAVQELILTRHCIEYAALGIFNVSMDGTIMSVNDCTCQSLGYSKEELGVMKYWDIAPTVNDEKASEIKKSLDNFGYATHELIHRRKDGSTFPVEITATIVHFNGEKYYFSIVKDITERKHAEQALRDTQFSVDHAAVPIFWIQEGGRFCYSNEACGYLGYSRDELLEMTAYDIDPLTSRQGMAKFLETLREKGSVTFETIHRTRDGNLVPVEVILNEMERDGKGFKVSYVRDISERKTAEARIARSEQKFRAIFENAHDAIFLIAADSSYVDCNPAATELFRCAKADILTRNPQFFSPPVQPGGYDTVDKAREIMADVLRGNPQCFEWRHRRSDGSDFDAVVVLSRFELDGEPMLMAIVRDISQRKSLEDQLHHAQKMEAVGQLAGGVAHDFNNMLTAIIGFTDLVSMKLPANDPSRKYVEQIMAAAKRAAELTQGLLSFSRKEIMTPKPENLNDIVVRLEKMLGRLIRASIELRVETSPVGLDIIADRGKTEQVIMNLMTNAGDSIKDVGVITIKTSTFEMSNQFLHSHGYGKTGRYACVTVSDTGSGMDEETKKRIFEPFFTTKETGKGTGLGLAIVYGIVKQHNGFICVDSEPDKGTTFSIYLPLAGSSPESGHSAQSAPTNAFHGNKTLLLAEDDVAVNNLVKVVLEEAGYTVISAVDGKEALDKFRKHEGNIALLILDPIMPKMSGKGVLDIIRQANPGIKALFISGYPAEVLRNADMLQEDDVVMMKPVAPNELLCKIRDMLDCQLPE